MSFRLTTKHLNEDAVIESAFYGDDSTAWVLYSVDGERLCVATVCMADYGRAPDDGCVFIKTWSENEGVCESLLAAGLIEPPHEYITAGFAEDGVAHCKIAKGAS